MLDNGHGRGRGNRSREDLKKGPARRDARDDGRYRASETDRMGHCLGEGCGYETEGKKKNAG